MKVRDATAPRGPSATGVSGRRRRRRRAPGPPARALTTVRSAVAVRPARPMTRPRSSGLTRTSSSVPRRSGLLAHLDVVGVRDDAADQVLQGVEHSASACALGRLDLRTSRAAGRALVGRVAAARSRRARRPRARRLGHGAVGSLGLGLGSLGGPRASAGTADSSAGRLGRDRLGGLAGSAAWPRRPWLGGLGWPGAAPVAAPGWWPPRRRRRSPWRRPRRRRCLSAFGAAVRRVPSGAGRPLNFCQSPVTFRIASDLLGRLRADAEPVLRPLGVDLDERGVLLGVVLADLLDRPAVALGARVGDDDAVVRRADLAQALQTDLDGHGCGDSCYLRGVSPPRPGWGHGRWAAAGHVGPGERGRA